MITLQFGNGGLFDFTPASHDIHLAAPLESGGTGPALCGIDRHAKGMPGWSLGGGVSDPEAQACPKCLAVHDGTPVHGMFGSLFAPEAT